MVRCDEDEKSCAIEANKAILALKRRGGGPAHINIYTEYSPDFSIKDLPNTKVIERYSAFDTLPSIKGYNKITIFVGSHKKFSQKEAELNKKIEKLEDDKQ